MKAFKIDQGVERLVSNGTLSKRIILTWKRDVAEAKSLMCQYKENHHHM